MYTEQIWAGTTYLDSKIGTNWIWLIDLVQFNMKDFNCICGQLEIILNGGIKHEFYDRVLIYLKDEKIHWAGHAEEFGFSIYSHSPNYNLLQSEWIEQILQLRSQRPIVGVCNG